MRQTSIQSRNGESRGRIQEWGGGKGDSNSNWDKLRWTTEAFTFDYVNGFSANNSYNHAFMESISEELSLTL